MLKSDSLLKHHQLSSEGTSPCLFSTKSDFPWSHFSWSQTCLDFISQHQCFCQSEGRTSKINAPTSVLIDRSVLLDTFWSVSGTLGKPDMSPLNTYFQILSFLLTFKRKFLSNQLERKVHSGRCSLISASAAVWFFFKSFSHVYRNKMFPNLTVRNIQIISYLFSLKVSPKHPDQIWVQSEFI